jgi:aryl-alcohol dehydrogenase-like predicted oxidoreductase
MTNATTISVDGLPVLELPVALGFLDCDSFEASAPLLDAFVGAGGRVIDTAWVYRGGNTELLLGRWLTQRKNRGDVTIIGKGAHTPCCTPDAIASQLTESLDRMQTDYIDVYFMHRDDPAVPVGEFVDAINTEITAGRIRGPWGGSNWSMNRMDAAITAAQVAGQHPPRVLSNNFSLADMVTPVWDGCIGSSTADWREWLTHRRITNFAWSSQSRGFFTDRAGRDKFDDAELARCWYSDGNFARRDRAIELARSLGVKPIHVALAYVVHQPFQQVALMGPNSVDELHDSLVGLSITLTPDQVAWLRNGAGVAPEGVRS